MAIKTDIPQGLIDLPRRIEAARDSALAEATRIGFDKISDSYHRRFFDTGEAMRGLTASEDRLSERSMVRRVEFENRVRHARFGEWGTGRRGSASGVTPPSGYVYGKRPGMAARQPATRGLKEAREGVIQAVRNEVKKALG